MIHTKTHWKRTRWAIALAAVVSPILGISPLSGRENPAKVPHFKVRTINGTGNNLKNPEWGSVGEPLLRLAEADYSDGVMNPAGRNRKNAREISNTMATQEVSTLIERGASDFIWQWGQFLDHDLSLTPSADPLEEFHIEVPVGDPFFDPDYQGEKLIFLARSIHDGGSTLRNPRQQLNLITAFVDASNVYGSDEVRAAALRIFEGGVLATTSGGRFLPFNTFGLPNAGGPDPTLFLAGDVRANEQVALTALHTLFVREHNRLANQIAAEHPGMSDEDIFQRARKMVGAQMEVITYNEFLPLLLGPGIIKPYRGYNPRVNPGISNELSTAAYRFGHSTLSPTLLRVNMPGNEKVATSLKDAYFNPKLIHKGGGISPLLRGLATQQAQRVDNLLVDGVRNFLFGLPGRGGSDLASLNIQRGRDHGLPNYHSIRKAIGLKPVRRLSEISSDPDVQAALAKVYADVNDIDLWVGGLAEDPVEAALVGETFYAIITDQFVRVRDGDRFWYQNDPFFTTNPILMAELERTTLADIIRRNTRVGEELQDDVFRVK